MAPVGSFAKPRSRSVLPKAAARSVAVKPNGQATKKKRRAPREPKLSKTNKPHSLTLEDWQRELRRQFGREQKFKLENVGEHPVFSEFLVTNPASHSTYRVAIRGPHAGDNYCSCADFATNELGTCKHVEFTLAKLLKKRESKSLLDWGYVPPFSEVYVQYGAQRELRFRAGTACPDELKRLALKYFTVEGQLRESGYRQFEKFLEQSAAIDTDLRCYDDALAMIASVRDGQTRRETIDKAFPEGSHSPAFDTLLKVKLYDYQREGALFAAKAGRSLIGDEMGLGKTIQAIATAEILAQHMGVERVLIICPTSLKYQWEREIAKFTTRDATVISGLIQDRRVLFETPSFFKILNYDTVHRDLDLIRAWSPDLVILDEAQRIKNWSTRVARSVKQVPSPYAVVLTGTPLENRLEELVSIVQFIDRQRLGPTYRLLHTHQQLDEHGKVVGYRDLNRIGETLEPILIRRQKKDIAMQLPPRLDKTFFMPMTQLQRDMHSENQEMVAKLVHKWRRYGFLTESDQRKLMIGLQNMRMSCDSSYLLDQGTDSGVKADEVVTLLDELIESPANKVVIFSQWLRMHALLVKRIKDKPWGHVLFHGGVESSKRKDLVDQFREDPNCRVFLATDAGGVGLNLQHANIVINMDLPWNPAVLEQRIGRVHRLGQTQPVSVVNYVSQGTIEEGMLGVIQFKKNLFAGVLDGGEKNVFLGGSKLKKFMETVDKITGNMPAPVAEEAAESAQTSGPSTSVYQETPATESTSDSKSGNGQATNGHQDHKPAAGSQHSLSSLLQQGLSLMQQLATASQPADEGDTSKVYSHGIRIDSDEYTGKPYLRLPVPDPEVLGNAWQAIGKLLESLQR
jgi:superfamily II DNA or RNA helicase